MKNKAASVILLVINTVMVIYMIRAQEQYFMALLVILCVVNTFVLFCSVTKPWVAKLSTFLGILPMFVLVIQNPGIIYGSGFIVFSLKTTSLIIAVIAIMFFSTMLGITISSLRYKRIKA